MEQIVNLQKTIPNKDKIDNLIDREFKFFINSSTVEQVVTIEPFFQMYEDLYFQIPAEGETNSHEYLIRRSSEIFQLGQDITNLQPLLDEIGDLRVQLLEASNRIFDLENQLNGN
jgi:hypothetical protein